MKTSTLFLSLSLRMCILCLCCKCSCAPVSVSAFLTGCLIVTEEAAEEAKAVSEKAKGLGVDNLAMDTTAL